MDGIELMASALHAAQARLDVSASNLANVSSDGFHKHVARTTFDERRVAIKSTLETSAGPLRRTGRTFDLAIAGQGATIVREPGGRVVESRGGSFVRDATGRLVDERDRALLGVHGVLHVSADATIDARGIVSSQGIERDRLRLAPHAEVQAGFLESANVDAVHEMIDVLGAQRAFETAQKTLSALDEERQKDADDVARVKS